MDTLEKEAVDFGVNLTNLLNPYDDSDSDDNTRTHIVNPPNNLHIWEPGMEMRELMSIARSLQIPVKTLCGKVFVPKRNPEKYPACEECIRIAGELMNEAGE